MRQRNLLDLLLLAAVWGGSFLFMRVAVKEFGPIALIELRVGLAALFLLPAALWRGKLPVIARHDTKRSAYGAGAVYRPVPDLCGARASGQDEKPGHHPGSILIFYRSCVVATCWTFCSSLPSGAALSCSCAWPWANSDRSR